MKKHLLLFVFVLSSVLAFGQIKIEKSSDVVVAFGRKYYVHSVKKGETLYSISRVYGVPTDQIILINKETISELNEGSALRIPVIDANYEPVPLKTTTFIEHTVQKNQSLYAIAQQYNTTQDLIIKYNPQIENGVEKGMVLKIPVEEQQSISADDEFFIYHQVRAGEDFKLIASQYGVTVEDLKQFNDKTPVVGKIVAVPKRPLSDEQKYILKYNSSLNPDFLNIDPNYFEDPTYPPCSKFAYNDTMTFNIAILLPLYITQNYGLSFDAMSNPDNAHFYGSTEIFYEYLQGTLLAIDALKKEGLNLKVHIFDTKADSATIEGILGNYEMKKMDLVFGPVYSKNYDIVKKYSEKYRINFVSPLTSQVNIIENNPFVYKVTPSFPEVTKFTAKYLSNFADTSMFYVISDGTPAQKELSDTLHQALTLSVGNPDSLEFKEITFSKFVTPYQNNLSKTKTNYVFIPSTNEVQVSAILNNLNALVTVNNYKITVLTLPVLENFTKLQSDWLSNLNIHFASTTVTDENDWEYKEFKTKYRDLFGQSPDKYSYIGYDATYYFIMALKQYGKYFQFCLGEDQEFMDSGMFMKFYFERLDKNSGFENKRLKMLYYAKDLELLADETI